MTYSIDLAYTTVPEDTGRARDQHPALQEPDLDDHFEEPLGERDESGMGFGMRDMQWMGISELDKDKIVGALENITSNTILKSRIAYITMYDEDTTELVFSYTAEWYNQSSEVKGQN
jgi:hypothetical protein